MAGMAGEMEVVEEDVHEWAVVGSEQMLEVVGDVDMKAKMEDGVLQVDELWSMEGSGQPQMSGMGW